MQKKPSKMNIHEEMNKLTLMPEARRVLHTGLWLILASLLRLLYDILRAAPFPAAMAERFGAMLEYPAAALALLTVLTFLVDRAVRAEREG